MSKVDLTLEEQETITVSKKFTSAVTASGTTRTTQQATVYVKDPHMFATVQLLKDSPTVLNIGKLFGEHVYAYEWREGQSPNLFKNGEALTLSCHLSHQESAKTTPFLYQQTEHVKQADVRLRVTECGKLGRVIVGEKNLNGKRNLRKACWTEIQNNVEVIESILQKHLLPSLYFPIGKEEHTIYSRTFQRIHIVKYAGARNLRELMAAGILNIKMVIYHARQYLVIQ